MGRSRPTLSGFLFVTALACAPLLGCYEPAPPPPPEAPPPPRALTISPQKRQTQAQQNRDSSQCQSQASAQAHSSDTWVTIFTSCMSGRGYLVE
jgi:hypothetical protein